MSGCTLHLTLPIPPSVNHCYQQTVTRAGRRVPVLTTTAKKWIAAAQNIAYQEMNRTGWVPPEKTKVLFEYTVYWPDHRRRDPSNIVKVMLDALCAKTKDRGGILMDDDQFCMERCMGIEYDKDDPRVEVKVMRA